MLPDEMTIALVRAARKVGASAFHANPARARQSRDSRCNATDRQLNLIAIHELARMKKMDAYIAIRGSHNITELSDVPVDQMKLLAKKMRPVQDQRVQKTKWVVLALAYAIDGATRRDEHRSIRRFLLSRSAPSITENCSPA